MKYVWSERVVNPSRKFPGPPSPSWLFGNIRRSGTQKVRSCARSGWKTMGLWPSIRPTLRCVRWLFQLLHTFWLALLVVYPDNRVVQHGPQSAPIMFWWLSKYTRKPAQSGFDLSRLWVMVWNYTVCHFEPAHELWWCVIHWRRKPLPASMTSYLHFHKRRLSFLQLTEENYGEFTIMISFWHILRKRRTMLILYLTSPFNAESRFWEPRKYQNSTVERE